MSASPARRGGGRSRPAWARPSRRRSPRPPAPGSARRTASPLPGRGGPGSLRPGHASTRPGWRPCAVTPASRCRGAASRGDAERSVNGPDHNGEQAYAQGKGNHPAAPVGGRWQGTRGTAERMREGRPGVPGHGWPRWLRIGRQIHRPGRLRLFRGLSRPLGSRGPHELRGACGLPRFCRTSIM